MINKILVPLDGSGHTARTIEFASNIARQEDAAVHLLHVVGLIEVRHEVGKGRSEFQVGVVIGVHPCLTHILGQGLLTHDEPAQEIHGIGDVKILEL